MYTGLPCNAWLSRKWAWSGSREQFLHCGLRKCRQIKSSVTGVINLDGQLVDNTYDGRARRGTSLLHVGRPQPSNSITSIFLDLSYKLFLHCYAAVGKDSTDVASRGPSATAELLVYNLQATEPRASFPETSLLRDRAKPPKCHAATQTGTRSTQTMTEACPLFALPGARVVT